MMDKLYLIEGINDFLIQKEVDKIINGVKIDIDVIKYDSETTVDLVIETLDTYDMFLKQKIVIWENPLFLLEKQEDFNDKKFLKYLDNPSDNILIITTNKLNNRLKLTSLVLDKFRHIKVKEISPSLFLKDNIKGYKMDNITINYFLNKVGKDFNMIYEELNKLKSYKLDDKIITKEDIDLVTNQNIEASIFDLIDAIIRKDKVKSYVKVLSNLSDFEISKMLDTKEYPVKLARGKGYSYKKNELLNLLYDLAVIDEDIKSGKQLIDVSLITFIMQM